jgi:hypothetical protein
MQLGMQLLQVDFWGEEEGKSMQPTLERVHAFWVIISLSLLYLDPS